MLVTFIGSPCSGKTTTAALLFATLKGDGIASEFVPEYARRYIMERRHVKKDISPLSDDEQKIIFSRQLSEEQMYQAASKQMVAVADSSALNSLLYMSPEARESVARKELWNNGFYNVAFVCEPVFEAVSYDPNRIHSYRDSLRLHAEIPALLKEHAPDLRVCVLSGSPQVRKQEAFNKVIETFFSC
jgi:nicotinamide riboside kinase